jgi:predicted O-methyltransferase YrrM
MNAEGQLHDCLSLMQTLMQYRQQPIYGQLRRVWERYSMLHVDVLLLVYHFAGNCVGHIVEIGAFLGGSTLAAALGVRDSGRDKALVAIEPGGKLKHERLGTKNILRDLERNLAKHGVSEMVTLIRGYSFEESTISAVRQRLGSDPIGLLIVDADGGVQRDIGCYAERLADGCWLVIDDYTGPAENIKVTPTRRDVDALVAQGCFETLGFYGWGTWIGRWRQKSYSS